jgi:hypothetical protein
MSPPTADPRAPPSLVDPEFKDIMAPLYSGTWASARSRDPEDQNANRVEISRLAGIEM